MIHDHIDNLHLYLALHPALAVVEEFLHERNLDALEPGTIELGEGVSCIVAEYQTVADEESVIECHRRFVDVHVVLQGVEGMGVAPVCLCMQAGEYVEENDYQLLHGELSLLALSPGTFAVFFPGDAHSPKRSLTHVGAAIRKLVFKLLV